jgi:hypothetical protein
LIHVYHLLVDTCINGKGTKNLSCLKKTDSYY